MDELRSFQRKTFQVQAVKITASNIRQMAEWCGGQYMTPENRAPYIVVPRGHNGNTVRGYIGDWVTRLSSANNYHVYKDHVFREAFKELPGEVEKLSKVAHEILQVLPEQFGGGDPYSLAVETARKILQYV